jgi:Hydrazine synthase alpha subunit middle domain
MTAIAKDVATAASLAFLGLICISATSPSQTSVHGIDADLIVTSAPVYLPLAALRGEERFPQGAQLLVVHNGEAAPLVNGFAATADAEVSFDATTVLFAGKKAASDPWQIWELTMATRAVRKVVAGDTDLIRPLYLPGGRIVYARHTLHGFQIESAALDGSGVQQIAYLPASAVPDHVLEDGRILFESGFPLGSGSTPEMFLVYQDGSGVESYRCDHGTARWGGRQLSSGDVVFTHGTTLARFTSSLAREAPIAAPRAEYTGGIVETIQGEWMVSARVAPGKHYALDVFDPSRNGAKPSLEPVFARTDRDLVEPALIAPRNPPNHHPSALHPWDYANLLALDARQSRGGALKTAPATVRLHTLDASGHEISLGAAPVEADGSFFVQVRADAPIRFTLLDAKGATLRQERGWFWIRRGEQRYCVGCHVGPERAPENRVPQVLLRTTTPADLTGTHAASANKAVATGGN